MHRDISSYEKYTLSEQTKQAMKNINFDVWQWEPNEVKLDDVTKNKKEINMNSISNNFGVNNFSISTVFIVHLFRCLFF